MSTTYYRQCTMRRDDPAGFHQRCVSWIPERFAKVGKYLKLKNDDDTWTDGWKVQEVGDRKDHKAVASAEQAHKKQRANSDI
jgi:hypothetical protein